MKKILTIIAITLASLGLVGGTAWAMSTDKDQPETEEKTANEGKQDTPPAGGPAYLYEDKSKATKEAKTHMPKDVPVTIYDKDKNVLWKGTQGELMRNKKEISEKIKEKNNGKSPF
ncbi:hypothetical protein J0K78_04060 [Halobacillus sp. GSS1]|uniref:hypothetical protein n=1 Tax=Halobacillus sp. GSS1 TaxID=2815919 RepID=UPI001A908204|nr:hypothetical protein [Halobacillus sp. GSS1]MBN9653432.1 hypothetical protein [Halobacillus sp. GSS1]